MDKRLNYTEIRKYFSHNEWRYISEVIDRETHDFGHSDVSRSVSVKIDKLNLDEWDNLREENLIIESYYKQLNDKDQGN